MRDRMHATPASASPTAPASQGGAHAILWLLTLINLINYVDRYILAAVGGQVQGSPQHINALGIAGVNADFAEVKRPRAQVVEFFPALTPVLGTKDAAQAGVGAAFAHLPQVAAVGLVGLHHSINDAWIAAKDRQAAPPQVAVGQPVP